MQNLLLFSIIFFSFSLLTSCSKDDTNGNVDTVTIKSDIFQCCNIWDEASTDLSDVEEEVKVFLVDRGIVPIEVTRGEGTPFAFCTHCCKCPTGEALFIEINQTSLQSALGFGFEEA